MPFWNTTTVTIVVSLATNNAYVGTTVSKQYMMVQRYLNRALHSRVAGLSTLYLTSLIALRKGDLESVILVNLESVPYTKLGVTYEAGTSDYFLDFGYFLKYLLQHIR